MGGLAKFRRPSSSVRRLYCPKKNHKIKNPGDCSSPARPMDRADSVRRSQVSKGLEFLIRDRHQSSADLLRPSDGSTALKKIAYHKNPKGIQKKDHIKQKSLKNPGDCSSMTSLIDRTIRIRRSDGSTA